MAEISPIILVGLTVTVLLNGVALFQLYKAVRVTRKTPQATPPAAESENGEPAEKGEEHEAKEEEENEESSGIGVSKAEILRERAKIIRALEKERGTIVVPMIFRNEPWESSAGGETILGIEDIEKLVLMIRDTPAGKPIDVILHIPDGVDFAAQLVAMALKHHDGKVAVMVPFYAMSGGTYVALAADEIMMERYSILGPADPQVRDMPALPLISVTERKQVSSIDDKSLVMAHVASMLRQNALDFVRWLLLDKMDSGQAESVAKFLAGGFMAHETPITLDVVRAIGLKAQEGVPELVYKLFSTYRFKGAKRPGRVMT